MGPGLRVQIEREFRDLRFVSVSSLIGKYLFGVGGFFLQQVFNEL
jgi:hypothetical protein